MTFKINVLHIMKLFKSVVQNYKGKVIHTKEIRLDIMIYLNDRKSEINIKSIKKTIFL